MNNKSDQISHLLMWGVSRYEWDMKSPLIVAKHFSISPKLNVFSLEDLKILHLSWTQLVSCVYPWYVPCYQQTGKQNLRPPCSCLEILENQPPKLPNRHLFLSFFFWCYIWVVATQTFFYFHPYLGKWSNLTTVNFFRWVETTNQLF